VIVIESIKVYFTNLRFRSGILRFDWTLICVYLLSNMYVCS